MAHESKPASPLEGLTDEFDLVKALPADKAREYLIMIRAEVHRLGKFNCSVEHLGTVLNAAPGTEPFDGRLHDFCEMAKLEFDAIGEHLEFRRAPVKPVQPVKK